MIEFYLNLKSENVLSNLLPDQEDINQSYSFNSSTQNLQLCDWEHILSFTPVDENVNEKEDESRYFISSNKSKENTPVEVSYCANKKNLFKVSKKIDTSEELLQNKRKRGRKSDPNRNPGMKIHEKTDID